MLKKTISIKHYSFPQILLLSSLLFCFGLHSLEAEEFDFSSLQKLTQLKDRPFLKKQLLPQQTTEQILDEEKELSKKQGVYQVAILKNALIYDLELQEYFYAPETFFAKIYIFQDKEGHHFIDAPSPYNFRLKVHSSGIDTIREFQNLNNFELHHEYQHPMSSDSSKLNPILDFKIAGKRNAMTQENKKVAPHFLWTEAQLAISTKIPYLLGISFVSQQSLSPQKTEWERKDYKLGPSIGIPLSDHHIRPPEIKLTFLYTFSGERKKDNKKEEYKGQTISILYHQPFNLESEQGFNFNLGLVFDWYQMKHEMTSEFNTGIIVMLGYTLPLIKIGKL